MFHHVTIHKIVKEGEEDKQLISSRLMSSCEFARQEHLKVNTSNGNVIASLILYDQRKGFAGLDSISIRPDYEGDRDSIVMDAKQFVYKLSKQS